VGAVLSCQSDGSAGIEHANCLPLRLLARREVVRRAAMVCVVSRVSCLILRAKMKSPAR
jgi:hypothetical protein